MRGFRRILFFMLVAQLPYGACMAALEHPYVHREARLLGMASAETALARHPNPLFGNPAALVGLDRGWTVTPVNLSVGTTKRMRGFLTELDKRLDIEDDDEQREALTELLADYRGRNLHAQVTTTPLLAWNRKRYALALSWIGSARLDARPHQGFGRTGVLSADGRALTGPVLGVALEHGRWRVGLGFKELRRRRVARSYSVRELVAITQDEDRDFSDDLKDGRARALDVGIQFEPLPGSRWQPRLGANLKHIGDLDFGASGRIPQRLDIGASVHPPSRYVDTQLSLEYVDVLHRISADDDVIKRTRAGVRWQLYQRRFSSLAVSAGFYQGEPSFGVDGELASLALSAATYVEEQGAFAGQDPERRYVVGVSLGF